MPVGVISRLRREFHDALLGSLLTRSATGIPSNADKASKLSIDVAHAIIEQIGPGKTVAKLAGQTAGSDFEGLCAGMIREALGHLNHLRPGVFTVLKGGGITRYDQYAHLSALEAIARGNREIATALGSDYLIKPDIVVSRDPLPDAVINATGVVVDATTARLTGLRQVNAVLPTLHASISCKWTLRSDRAQNARSEGLNLVRNRKGRLPHVAVITGEPLPGRIASLALGTGDIDCVYHFALPELRQALLDLARDNTLDLLDTMVQGKRLRDISDLPLDLVI